MKHKVKMTVLKKECYTDLQEQYLADPHSGPCPYFEVGQEFLIENGDFFRMMNGQFCGEAWDCVSRYIYAALQGGSIMQGWTNDEKMMITCCNDGTRPVIFKLERIDEEI
ncbi:TIGR04076 family protein [Eubacteriales bacterium OttesenSCG-928-N14]|nr:TIGR04076 family protein [Eubacteriales bacterium OttesenSCG-928-N14]